MKLELIEKKEELKGVISFVFKPLEAATWKAGQYAHYVLHHEPTDDRGSDRWFTIAAAPFEENFVITTRIDDTTKSTFKKKLESLQIGKKIEVGAIEGDFVLEDYSKEYVFIAGGIGITPFYSILKQLDHENVKAKITLLYANRDENVPFKEEFEKIARNNPELKIHYIIAPERLDETKIQSLVGDITKPIFYVSGPEPMVESLGNKLKEVGVSADHLKQDWFPGYPAE